MATLWSVAEMTQKLFLNVKILKREEKVGKALVCFFEFDHSCFLVTRLLVDDVS